jgi:hypothetical protein
MRSHALRSEITSAAPSVATMKAREPHATAIAGSGPIASDPGAPPRHSGVKPRRGVLRSGEADLELVQQQGDSDESQLVAIELAGPLSLSDRRAHMQRLG